MSKLAFLISIVVVMAVAALADEPYGNEKKYDGFFQYVNVPGPYEYELGFKRGNAGHYTSRFEQFKDARFRTKVKWGDEEGSYGEQLWEYNHAAAPAYPAPAYPASAYPASGSGYSEPEYPEPPAYRAGPAAPFAASAPNPAAVKPARPAVNKPKN